VSFEDEMAAALDTFVAEAREILQEMEAGLLSLESAADPEVINAIFRDAHTIKGSAGLFGLTHIVHFTHSVETVLDLLRDGSIPVSSELVGVLLPCRDHIADLIETMAGGSVVQDARQAEAGQRLLVRLSPFIGDGPLPTDEEAAAEPAESDVVSTVPASDAPGRHLHLSLRFGADSLRNGMDPLSFIGYLDTLGTVTGLITLAEGLPDAAGMDAETCYLGFEATLRTEASVEAVEGVFDFVRDDGDIRVLPHDGPVSAFDELLASHADPLSRAAVQAFLARSGAMTGGAGPATGPLEDLVELADLAVSAVEVEPVPALSIPPLAIARPAEASLSGPSSSVRPATVVPPRATGEAGADRVKATENRSIRVDAPRLDRLIDVVGELVIAGSAAGLRASQAGNDALLEATGEVMRLVEEVRDSALQLRMVPIGTTFSRFQRVVRDVSAELGKDIALVISGGDTEVDKALVERIGDPLMHLVRNSMDHGIESAAERIERGKPARGLLILNAYHDSGSIVIEVTDDGGGIDRDKVLAKAIERGLVDPGAALTDAEVFAMIFEPGFSTAEAVSNLSGRGVGMDVVKRNVTSLRGTIDVESTVGEGSTMRIRLPLTLAIIDGFLVGVGGSSFVVPLDRVVECVARPSTETARDCMDLRGEVLPFIRLRSLFSISGDLPRRENVVVVDYAGVKTGLVVDSLIGEFQTVIKPLGRLFEHVQGISGSTILGSGEVALIIDVPVLVRHYGDREHGGGVAQRAPGELASVR
jgi:two-component system chemotaxis sensor kinase CheA